MKIGITQRVSTQFHGQPHDCLDSKWAGLLVELGGVPVPLSNLDATKEQIWQYLDLLEIDAAILTGGNDIAGLGNVRGSMSSQERDFFEKNLVDWSRSQQKPLLGICRGFQFLNIELGGKLSPIDGHSGCTHPLRKSDADLPAWLAHLPEEFTINSFHTYAISPENLAPGFVAAAFDTENFVEAAFHESEPIGAIMWHPEREAFVDGPGRKAVQAFMREYR